MYDLSPGNMMHAHRNGNGGAVLFSELVSDVRLGDIRERLEAAGRLFFQDLLHLFRLIHRAPSSQ